MARTFTGSTSDYLENTSIPNSVLNPENGVFSVSCWLKVGTIAAYMTAFGRVSSGGGFSNRWYVGCDGTSTYFSVWYLQPTGFGLEAVSTTAPSSNTWYHVAGTNSAYSGGGGGDLKIYVNGSLEATTSTGSYPHDGLSPQAFQVGKTTDNVRAWDGDIAEIAFYKGTVLSADQVAALSRGTSPLLIGALPSNYWPLYGAGDPESQLHGDYNLDVVGSPAASNHAPVGPPWPLDDWAKTAETFRPHVYRRLVA